MQIVIIEKNKFYLKELINKWTEPKKLDTFWLSLY